MRTWRGERRPSAPAGSAGIIRQACHTGQARRNSQTGQRAWQLAELKNWYILRKLRCCPWRVGKLAKAIHVLQIREANAG
jgi:hypothetical protein